MTVITGEENIKNARILTLRAALRLEAVGMKGRFNAYAIVKKEFKFKGNKKEVLAQLNLYIEQNILPKAATAN